MLPRQPSATLFPYTTLFRSCIELCQATAQVCYGLNVHRLHAEQNANILTNISTARRNRCCSEFYFRIAGNGFNEGAAHAAGNTGNCDSQHDKIQSVSDWPA